MFGYQGPPSGGVHGASHGTLLLEAAYDLSKSPVQTFPVKQAGVFDHVRLTVCSQHRFWNCTEPESSSDCVSPLCCRH